MIMELENSKIRRPPGLTVKVSIDNFSDCALQGGIIETPLFGNELFGGRDKWYLTLYPSGHEQPNFISCYLNGPDEGPSDCKYALSIKCNGLFEDRFEGIVRYPANRYINGYSEFLSHKELKESDGYLDKDTLTIQCRMWKMKADDLLPKADVVLNGHEVWKENLRKFCNFGKFSDATLRTLSNDFPAHRVILSTQSEVFSAMFEHDMKERNTGVIDLKDLEDDVVSKMLTFIYTNTLEDIDFNTAQKLFFAADLYGITALRIECSRILMGSIESSNVCDILALAHTHGDTELKARARDFVDVHAGEVVVSDGWKNLIETHSGLTSEILQWMFCKKFLTD